MVNTFDFGITLDATDKSVVKMLRYGNKIFIGVLPLGNVTDEDYEYVTIDLLKR